MPFPPSPREVYDNNPLTGVICQIRYPAILEIAANSPAQFQNAVRGDYPWYEQKSPGIPKELSDLLAGLPFPMPPIPQQPEHHFFTEDRNRSISLTQEFIALSEKGYGRWEDFRGNLEFAEQVFRDTYRPAFYTRIGLRYIDLLIRDNYGLDEVPWLELLNPSFSGLLGDPDLSRAVQGFQSVTELKIPDVEGGIVKVQHGLAEDQSGGQAYLIDADFQTNARSSPKDAFATLDRFNRWSGYLFRWAISRKLRDALGPHLV